MATEVTTFKASDGREFKTKAEAEKHEKMVTAQAEYKSARDTFARALAETQKTADGRAFEWGFLKTYWYVRDAYHWPELVKVDFCLPSFYLDDRDELTIIDRAGTTGQREYQVSKLFRSEFAAKTELLRLCRVRLAEYGQIVADLSAEVEPAEAPTP